jgi:hypothetical protein
MSADWLDDETMSREETLERFEALGPEPAVGPHVPAGGYLVQSVRTFMQGVIVDSTYASVGLTVRSAPQTVGA